MTKIIQNQTIGEIILKRRKELNISLEEVEAELKMRSKFLKSIETNRFTIFTSHTQAKGFIKNYAKLLSLNPESLIAMYKRDIENIGMKRKVKIINEIEIGEEEKKRNERLKRLIERISVINITPRIAAFLVSILVVIFFGGYILNGVKEIFRKPKLEIESPITLNGDYSGSLEYFSDTVKIKGKTEPRTTIKINEVPIFLSPNYEFESNEIPLPNESNIIVISAQNNFGSETKIQLNLTKSSRLIDLMQVSLSTNNEQQMKIIVDGEVRIEREILPSEIITFNSEDSFELKVLDASQIILKINGEEFKLNSSNSRFRNTKKEIIQEVIN